MTALRRVPVSYRVAIIVAVVSLVSFFVFSSGNNGREKTLLQNEASQVASIEQSTMSSVLSVLDTLATTTTVSDGATQAFQTEAQNLVHGPVSVALAKVYFSEYVVFAEVGNGFKVGQALNQGVFSTFHPTGLSVVTGPVVSAGNQSISTFAVGPPLVPTGNAIFMQFTVNPFVASILPAGPALSDLRVALYGSPNPVRTNLVVATSSDALPWPGPVVSVPIAVGNTTWTVVADARGSLIGGFASAAPLIILILGLLLAVFMGITVEIWARRRRSVLIGPVNQARIATESTAGVPVPQAPVPQAPVPQAPVPQAPVPQAPVPQAPVPQAPVPQAPVPQAPVPQAPVPQAPVPQAPVPTAVAKEKDPRPAAVAATQKGSFASPANPPGESDQNEALKTEASFHADWRPDPFGRSKLRRFFLGSPTSLVKDETTEYYDPIPQSPQQGETSSPGPQSHSAEDNDRSADSGAEPTAQEQQFLEVVAARVAETIAEEIGELLAVTSALREDVPDADSAVPSEAGSLRTPEPQPPRAAGGPTSPATSQPPPPPPSVKAGTPLPPPPPPPPVHPPPPVRPMTPPPSVKAAMPPPPPPPPPPPSMPPPPVRPMTPPPSVKAATPPPPPPPPPSSPPPPVRLITPAPTVMSSPQPPSTSPSPPPEKADASDSNEASVEDKGASDPTASKPREADPKTLIGAASILWRRIRGTGRGA